MKTLNMMPALFGILFCLSAFSCNKATPVSDASIDTSKLYTGIIIQEACPSYAIIQVTNANIGDDWTFGTNYKNVIAISNRPDSANIHASISFYLSSSKNYLDCVIQRPCLFNIIIDKMPSKTLCAKSITILSK